MSIINDALRKAEQFRKWGAPQVPQKFGPEFGSPAAVLDESPPPKIQNIITRTRIAVQAPAEVSHEIPLKPAVRAKASSSHSFLIVSLIGLSILIVVTLFLLLSNFSTNTNMVLVSEPSRPQPVTRQEAAVIQTAQTVDDVSARAIERKSAEIKAADKRDKKVPRPPKSRYQLTGIYGIGEHERFAFINGKIVQIGGTISDATIVSIGQNTVTLKRGSRIFVLTMP